MHHGKNNSTPTIFKTALTFKINHYLTGFPSTTLLNLSFSFKFIDRRKIFNELQKLKSKKVCQGSDIPVKIIKENINIITDSIYNILYNSLLSLYFLFNLKNTDMTPDFLKNGSWKRWKLLPCKHPSGFIKSLWKVYVWSNVCIL